MPRDAEDALNRQRFEMLVEAYGADLRRFPEGERRDAEAFLAENDDARLLLKREQELDDLLDVLSQRGTSVKAPLRLEARIVESALASATLSPLPLATNGVALRPRQRIASALFLAAAAAAGLWFGAQSTDDTWETSFDDSEQLAAAFDPLDWEDEGAP